MESSAKPVEQSIIHSECTSDAGSGFQIGLVGRDPGAVGVAHVPEVVGGIAGACSIAYILVLVGGAGRRAGRITGPRVQLGGGSGTHDLLTISHHCQEYHYYCGERHASGLLFVIIIHIISLVLMLISTK